MKKMIFIPGSVPSSKNSRQLTKSGLFIGSKATQKYRKLSTPYWIQYKDEFKEMIKDLPKPIIVGFHFIKRTRNLWDFINPVQTVQDIMVKNGWIDDDNISEILPVPLLINGEYCGYDKTNHGVYIAVMENMCEEYQHENTNQENT